MKAKLVKFGQIKIAGQTYDYDVVIAGGVVSKRRKEASKAYRDRYGITGPAPLGAPAEAETQKIDVARARAALDRTRSLEREPNSARQSPATTRPVRRSL